MRQMKGLKETTTSARKHEQHRRLQVSWDTRDLVLKCRNPASRPGSAERAPCRPHVVLFSPALAAVQGGTWQPPMVPTSSVKKPMSSQEDQESGATSRARESTQAPLRAAALRSGIQWYTRKSGGQEAIAGITLTLAWPEPGEPGELGRAGEEGQALLSRDRARLIKRG